MDHTLQKAYFALLTRKGSKVSANLKWAMIYKISYSSFKRVWNECRWSIDTCTSCLKCRRVGQLWFSKLSSFIIHLAKWITKTLNDQQWWKLTVIKTDWILQISAQLLPRNRKRVSVIEYTKIFLITMEHYQLVAEMHLKSKTSWKATPTGNYTL